MSRRLRQAGITSPAGAPCRAGACRPTRLATDDERQMMKRSLLAVASVAVLLTGCATGDTGHLDPEISPNLMELRSSPSPDAASGGDDEESEPVETPAPGSSAAPSNHVEAAFSASSGSEAWFTDVTAVDVEDEEVLVTTRLQPGDQDAVDVCEAAFEAASSTGLNSPSVEVRSGDGTTLSQRDTAAGDEACSRTEG
jgi:hypothetical protein